MRFWLAAWLAAALAAPAFCADDGFDDYPARPVEEVLKEHPCASPGGGLLAESVMFHADAKFTGGPRAPSKERLDLLRRWLAKLGSSEPAAGYGKEIRVTSGRGAWWAHINNTLLDSVNKELGPAETADFYFSFIGCAGSDPVFVIDGVLTLEESPDESSYLVLYLGMMPLPVAS
ncbi:MAG: hypothetical protein NTX64_11075 [Elusimicrobia bacterium]|nr:hypothetical protein [Elusimicrobiota bacterium]